MEEVLKILSGFLGGGLFTALVFVFTQTNKITSIETRQKLMKDTLDEHVKAPISTCPMHIGAVSDINVLITNQKTNINRVTVIEDKVDHLEQDMAVLKSKAG